MDVAAALSRSRWFAGQPPALRAALLAAGRTVHVPAGRWVYGEGDDDTGLVAVLDGAVRLEVAVGDNATVLVDMVQPPAVIGQSRARGGGPRIVTARAARPSIVWLIDDRALARLGEDDPALWRAMTALLYGQLETSVRLSAQMLALPPRARIAARLALLARDGAAPVTQGDLAELCGLSRKTAAGHLAALAAAGAIRRGYGAICVTDAALLARFAASPRAPI